MLSTSQARADWNRDHRNAVAKLSVALHELELLQGYASADPAFPDYVEDKMEDGRKAVLRAITLYLAAASKAPRAW